MKFFVTNLNGVQCVAGKPHPGLPPMDERHEMNLALFNFLCNLAFAPKKKEFFYYTVFLRVHWNLEE